MMKTKLIAVCCVMFLAVSGGCAGMNFYTAASPETVATLKPGVTTVESLVLIAGDPDSVVKMGEGVEIYTWSDTLIYSRGLSTFPLWVIGGSKRTSSTTYYLEVRFKNGLMTGHRFMSTAPLDEEMKALSASGDLKAGPDPATAPQFSVFEGVAP